MTVAQIPFANFMRPSAKRVAAPGEEIVVDNFAGGGGASTGIELALGRSVDIAINHDPEAIEMHARNHPQTKHLCESVWDVDPVEACAGRPVGVAWFSPDCKHFSRAKGAKPVSKKIRGLAWVAVKWAKKMKPRVIFLENVREFQDWGPVKSRTYCPPVKKGVRVTAIGGEHKGRNGRVVGRFGEDAWAVKFTGDRAGLVVLARHLEAEEITESLPDPTKRGQTFKRFVRTLEKRGYSVEWRVLNAAEYGAPTHRRRLFIVARCDGRPIVWPEPTHGPNRPSPYRTAAECIDWSIPCPSIFERKRPLAEKTLRRIAMGLKRYVLENPSPFIVNAQHGGDHFRGQAIDKPLSTVTGKHGYGVVAPHLVEIANSNWSEGHRAVDAPMPTVTANPKGGSWAVAAASLIQTGYGEREGQLPRALDIEKPLGTVVSGQKHALVAALLNKYRGNSAGTHPADPLPTITSGCGAKRPAGAAHALGITTANLIKFYGTNTGAPLDAPMPTVTAGAGGGHLGEVRAFLIKYFGCGVGQEVSEPLHTVTTKDRFGLVTIDGQDYAIADIGLRMLTPRELLRAQFGPELAADYLLPRTASAAVAKIGNSVAPLCAAAIVQANVPELVVEPKKRRSA